MTKILNKQKFKYFNIIKIMIKLCNKIKQKFNKDR